MKKIFKPTFFLPIESTVRELDYKINLARHMCVHGLDVILGNPSFIRDELKYKNYRAIFLEKGLNPDPDYYRELSAKGIYLYDLGDEGAAEPVYSINYPPAVEAIKQMRKVFLWGKAQKEDLIKRNPEPALQEKYEVIGNPGFELCTEKYRDFLKKLKPKKLPHSYILVNTNFGCFQSHDVDEQLKACSSISPMTKQMILDGYAKEKDQWTLFQEWLDDIIQSFPNEQFLIRPHPCEIRENYEKAFGQYPNIIISKEGNANYVIASAKIVLHKDCTTAMQSYIMGISAISLGGSSAYDNYVVQWPLQFSALPKDLDEAKVLIKEVLTLGRFNDNLKNQIKNKSQIILNDYFCNLENSSEKLVSSIIEDAKDLLVNVSPYQIIDTRTILQKIKLFIRRNLPLHYKVPKAARETLLNFTKHDIFQRLALLEAIDPIGIKFKVTKIFPNAYKIEKN